MAANSNFSAQDPSHPVAGGYIQPASGVTGAVVSPSDPSGNAYATSLAASGTANLQTASYRDSIITVQASATASAPASGAVVTTCTPGTAGLWEVTGTVTISGTTVAATDTHNMKLEQTSTARLSPILVVVPSTTGSTVSWAFGPVTLNLGASDTVNVKAIASATGSSVYAATIYCKRVG